MAQVGGLTTCHHLFEIALGLDGRCHGIGLANHGKQYAVGAVGRFLTITHGIVVGTSRTIGIETLGYMAQGLCGVLLRVTHDVGTGHVESVEQTVSENL